MPEFEDQPGAPQGEPTPDDEGGHLEAPPADNGLVPVAPPAPMRPRRDALWLLRGGGGFALLLGQAAGAAWAISWLLGADSISSHWLRQHRPETAAFLLAFAVIYAIAYWHEEPR